MSNLDETYAELILLDLLISKVLKISQLAQIARKEKRIREYLLAKWQEKSAIAVKNAVSLAKKSKEPEKIISTINEIMGQWADSVKKIVSYELKAIYKLGYEVARLKAAGKIKGILRYGTPIKKANGKSSVDPAFDLIDEEAVESLINHQLYWIGEHYSKNVSDTIATIVREKIIESGEDPVLAGRLIMDALTAQLGNVITPDGFTGTAEQYFEGLAANVTTNARVFGQMRAFTDVGVTTYTIVNPMDERTCERCAMLEGIPFTTSEGAAQMERMLGAKTPDEVKRLHPWLSASKFKEIASGLSGAKLGAAFMEKGIAFPPYHFKCRCTVDIETSTARYEDLE